jgi:hypothetical protein
MRSDRQTGGQTEKQTDELTDMTKLIVALRYFSKVPKGQETVQDHTKSLFTLQNPPHNL